MADIFTLHPQIAADSFLVRRLELCQMRLMNDSRFAWVLLLPERQNIAEITELSSNDQTQLMSEITMISTLLRDIVPCDRINVAAFGNMVPQLHVHIIARTQDDPAWPGSAIGFGERLPYGDQERDLLLASLS